MFYPRPAAAGYPIPVATGVAFQNSYPVTGKILSATTNEPPDGATVRIQGQETKVLTNADGAFPINASDTFEAIEHSICRGN